MSASRSVDILRLPWLVNADNLYITTTSQVLEDNKG